jgi:hypothetical protein
MTDHRSSLPFSTYLDENQLAYFHTNIVVANSLDDLRTAKYKVEKNDERLKKVEVSADVFTKEKIIATENSQGEIFVVIPIQNIAVIGFICKDVEMAELELF